MTTTQKQSDYKVEQSSFMLNALFLLEIGRCRGDNWLNGNQAAGFHLQQTPRPRHKKQSDYVVEQSSFLLIALYWLKIGRCRGRNWLYGNQALAASHTIFMQ